jgi:hypothetical protein
LTSLRPAWLFAAASLILANPLLHKTISDVCDWARARWGFSLYDWTALVAIPLVSILAASPFLVRGGHRLLSRRLAPLSLLILGALTVAAHRWLFVANIELIHFPQFALLSALLLAAGLGGVAAFLTATVAGILDETYQYFVVYAAFPGIYYDINDIVLNTIGAAWGVVLCADALRRRDGDGRPQGGSPPVGVEPASWVTSVRGAMLALLALPVVLLLDPPSFSPLLRPTDSGRALFRELSAGEGLVVCSMIWGLVALLMRDDGRSARHAVRRSR